MVTRLIITTLMGGELRKPDAGLSYAPLPVGREGESLGSRDTMTLASG